MAIPVSCNSRHFHEVPTTTTRCVAYEINNIIVQENNQPLHTLAKDECSRPMLDSASLGYENLPEDCHNKMKSLEELSEKKKSSSDRSAGSALTEEPAVFPADEDLYQNIKLDALLRENLSTTYTDQEVSLPRQNSIDSQGYIKV